MKKFLLCHLTAILFAMPFSYGVTYTMDQVHSEVGFSVKHLVVSNVKGKFTDYSASFDFDSQKSLIKDIQVEVKTASIDTGNKKRDEHLTGADFFNTAKYPVMTFQAKGPFSVKSGQVTQVKGELTILGNKKPVSLDVTYNGATVFDGVPKTGFSISAMINRNEFGMTWNHPVQQNAVGSEVKIMIEGEANGKK